jgi:hypothetical protein
MVAGYFNDDGILDIAAMLPRPVGFWIGVYLGTGDGTFRSQQF